ncbi:metallophosphoesterase [Paenibacillus radicis (ex Gao et al. 2016)]|uniref:Serine/threonine protein phosphatase n=1 Tax=Paenibacillus radicis (ex Gao et al. 2016) TaxID=1737354 RepID=A0A917GRZ5_9BACL|nr:metallophosphoesterase [Paenibacillus radicis (ex Gao et al. 2016)]GGG54739.1 serine/threonine protein phosphatase [Paenibacillus radicis (ex Gao et al. 2016)]
MSRQFVISDIHGHAEGMEKLLQAAGYQPGKDKLALLGDYIDADPATWESLTYVKKLCDEGAVALAGNMEVALLALINEKESRKTQEVIAEHEFIESLPYFVQSGSYLYVHAGIRPGIRLDRQSRDDLTTIREPFWGSDFEFPANIVFGHTPTHKMGATPGELWHAPGRLGIDTGAKHGHRLTLVELSGQTAYSYSTASSSLYGDYREISWKGQSQLRFS